MPEGLPVSSTWTALRQRKMVQWALAYLAAAWVVLQVVGLATDSYEWPHIVMRLSFGVVALGFVVTLVVAWYHGDRGEQKISGVELLILAVLLAVGGGVLWRTERSAPLRMSSASRDVVSGATPSTPASTAAPPATSIAVLPFVDMSQGKDQEYFSDGLSEELLNLLAQVPQLRVIARTSSFSFKGKEADIATIAKALNVANVLEGSVRKSGNTLRITAQLIRASDSSHLWSQTYDRQLTDVFKVQDEIASAVVAALKVRLLPAHALTTRNRSTNTEAHNQYLLGRQFSNRGSLEDRRRALSAYRQAIALDPDYAVAYAALAGGEFVLADTSGDAAGKDHALAMADRAIALAPELSDGYVQRGIIRLAFKRDWAGAQSDFEKALALNPGSSRVQEGYGRLMVTLGRLPQAIAAMRKATELDPLSGLAWAHLGRLLNASGQFGPARQALLRSLEISPQLDYAHFHLGATSLLQGKAQEALATYRQAGIGSIYRLAGIAMAEYSMGHARESQQALDEEISRHAQGAAYQIAEVYAWRGEKDKAFAWLDRAYAQNDGGLSFFKCDPLLAHLYSDPRYAAMLKRLDLPLTPCAGTPRSGLGRS